MPSLPLMENNNTVAGLPVLPAGNLPGNRIVVGSFSNVKAMLWAVEVATNPFSLALNHQVYFVANLLADVVVQRPAAFVISTDSGAQ